MKKGNIRTIELLRKFISDQYTEDELIELSEKANSVELDNSIKELLPNSFDDIQNQEFFSDEKIDENYRELSKRIGFDVTNKKNIFNRFLKYAAIITIPMLLGTLLTLVAVEDKLQDDGQFIFSVSKGNKGFLVLADGSKIWLDSSSKLLYNSADTREAYLEGKAYFNIAHDPKKQFKIKTDCFDIVVYGTSFNATAYKSDNTMEVDLVEGSIGIVDNNEILFKLKAGQSVLYDKQTKHYTIVDKDMTDVSLWIGSQLVIRDLTADELYRKLSAWYSVSIDLKNNDPNNRLYNLTITNESLENILSLVNRLSPMDYKIDGKEVTITYKRPN